MRNFIRSGYQLHDAESHEVDKQGNLKYFLNNLVGIVENGFLVRAWGSQRDITERKQVEEALRESNARLRFALDAGQLGDWDLELLTQTARRSLRHDQIFGYNSLLPDWSYKIFLKHVYPKDREFVVQKFQHTLSTGEEWYFECRTIWHDESIH